MSQASVKSDWIKWDGGECPVELSTEVFVRFRELPENPKIPCRAGDFRWDHVGNIADIVAYRVVTPTSQTFKEDFEKSREEIDENFKEVLLEIKRAARDQKAVMNKNKYLRNYPYDTIDIYRILQVYEVTDPSIQHAIKKLLCAGKRGYKDMSKDIMEAQMSLDRWFEMRKEENGNSD